jgi:hypothetical protein
VIRLLISFIAGLGISYLRRRPIELVVLGVVVAFSLSALSLVPYGSEGYGITQHLPFSFPFHAETQEFIVILVIQIMPPPPDIRLTMYFINAPIITLWYHSRADAFLACFAIFFIINLVSVAFGMFLGNAICRKPRLVKGRRAT